VLVLTPALEGRLQQAYDVYIADPNVLYAEPDYGITFFGVKPNDPGFDELWGMHNTGQTVQGLAGVRDADIDAPEAWAYIQSGTPVRVAIIDNGVDLDHEDLESNIWTNPDEFPGDANGDGCPGECGVDDDGDGLIDEADCRVDLLPDPTLGRPCWDGDCSWDDDENGVIDDFHGYDFGRIDCDPDEASADHGTNGAGHVGAVHGNGIGVAGVNPYARIVSLKVWNQEPPGEDPRGPWLDAALDALDYIMEEDIRVSNNSWGLFAYSQSLYDKILDTQTEVAGGGHIFVAAAGNDGDDLDGPAEEASEPYPCRHENPAGYPPLENLVCVAATAANDQIVTVATGATWASNYGPGSVDVGAPGLHVYTTTLDDLYIYRGGTSYAAPHAAGLVSLVMSAHSNWDYAQVKGWILASARQVDCDELDATCIKGKTVTGGIINAFGAINDCSDNGIPPVCEFNCAAVGCEAFAQMSGCGDAVDCNGNGVPDDCDIGSGGSGDCNENGVPDECESWYPVPPGEEQPLMPKNRYLSIDAGNPGVQTALRITYVDPLPEFEDCDPVQMWVNTPKVVSEVSGLQPPDATPPTFMAASATANPVYRDWDADGIVHVYSIDIVPGATYEIDALPEDCTGATTGGFYVEPSGISTCLWGDIVGDCAPTPCTAPNGIVDFLDITAAVDKFRNVPDPPGKTVKARADVASALEDEFEGQPDLLVDYHDIGPIVDAFRGFAYPFPVPTQCP